MLRTSSTWRIVRFDSAEDKDVTQSGCPVIETQQLSNGGSSQVPVFSLSSIFAS